MALAFQLGIVSHCLRNWVVKYGQSYKEKLQFSFGKGLVEIYPSFLGDRLFYLPFLNNAVTPDSWQ